MRKYQKGYTLVELLFVVWFLLAVSIIGGVGYVAFHFLAKFW